MIARAGRHVDLHRVWLFGSYARGKATRASDLDLAFEFSTSDDAGAGWAAFVAEADEETPALVALDLVALGECAPTFAREITTTGRLVYQRSA